MMFHDFGMIFDDVWLFFMMFHDFGMIFDDFSWCLIQCLMILDFVWWFSYLFLGWTSIRTSYFASARYQDFAGVGYLKGFIRLNNFVVKVAKNKLCPIHHPFITWEVFYTLSSFHWWTRISTETNPYHQLRSHIPLFDVNPTSQKQLQLGMTQLQANAREGLQRATWSRSAWSWKLYGAGAQFFGIFFWGYWNYWN